jgi:hypothetical protein
MPFLTEEGYYKTLPSPDLMGLFAAVLSRRAERRSDNFS